MRQIQFNQSLLLKYLRDLRELQIGCWITLTAFYELADFRRDELASLCSQVRAGLWSMFAGPAFRRNWDMCLMIAVFGRVSQSDIHHLVTAKVRLANALNFTPLILRVDQLFGGFAS